MHLSRLILLERAQRLGWPGLLGASLMLMAAFYAGLILAPAIPELTRPVGLSANTGVLDPTQQASAYPESDGGKNEVDAFRQGLPGQMDATTTINRIYALASSEGITLARGEYSMGIDARTRLARYQMTLPVGGSYPQLRRFIHSVMEEIPALALEDIDLRRLDIGTTHLEGRIRLTLYLSR